MGVKRCRCGKATGEHGTLGEPERPSIAAATAKGRVVGLENANQRCRGLVKACSLLLRARPEKNLLRTDVETRFFVASRYDKGIPILGTLQGEHGDFAAAA